MNINHLKFIREAALQKSFSKAAETCCVTQPTLSNAIAQFEDLVGGRLFKRTTRSVDLTRFGDHMLPTVEAVLDARDELLSTARAFHEADRSLVRIGLSPLIDSRLVSRAVGPFKDRNPATEVFLKQCFLDDLEARLDNETLDLALLPSRALPSARPTRRLYEEDLYFLPCDSELGASDNRNTVSLSDVAENPIILTNGCGLSDVIADLFGRGGHKLAPYPGQALSYAVVEEWAGLGLAAGILPRSKLSPGNNAALPIVEDDGTPATVSYEMVWREVDDAASAAEFMDHLAGTVPAMHDGTA